MVILFAPWLLLTGHNFPEYLAVALFCSVGFMGSALLFLSLVHHHFATLPSWVRLGGLLSLGTGQYLPFSHPASRRLRGGHLVRLLFLQLALFTFYGALKNPHHALRWLLPTSLGLGIAAASRYDYVVTGVVFLAVLAAWWRHNARLGEPKPWAIFAALAPIGLIGLLLAWYDAARFGSPLDFGQSYRWPGMTCACSLCPAENIPFTLWFYFLSAPHFSRHFPFIDPVPTFWFTLPKTYFGLEKVSGIFLLAPVSLLALALPLLSRRLRRPGDIPLLLLMGFMATCMMLLLAIVLTLSNATMRYLVDFTPALIFLGVISICYLMTRTGLTGGRPGTACARDAFSCFLSAAGRGCC